MTVRIVDKSLLRTRLARAHRRRAEASDFLMRAVASDLVERLTEAGRSFGRGVAFGGQTDSLARAMLASGKIADVIRLELTEAAFQGDFLAGAVADEEFLPLARASIDVLVSALMLQWTNDLPGALIQFRQALRPGGLFLGAMTGGRTLAELREALFLAESELSSGASLRVIPAVEAAEASALMQRAGFSRPIADRDLLTVRYGSMFELLRDLKAMGATNSLVERQRQPSKPKLFARAAEIYADRFSDADGRVRASFEIVFLTGWAPPDTPEKD
jgi:SAM-dependent methyltransferase